MESLLFIFSIIYEFHQYTNKNITNAMENCKNILLYLYFIILYRRINYSIIVNTPLIHLNACKYVN